MTKKKISSKKSPSKPLKKSLKKTVKSSSVKKPLAKKNLKKVKAAPKAKAAPKKAVAKAKPKSTKAAPKKVINKKPSSSVKKTTSPKKKIKASAQQAATRRGALQQTFIKKPSSKPRQNLSPFLTKQRQRLLQLKDTLLDSMSGVARGNLHASIESSGFGMHQADAGSDAYDRDFALSILSQEQNSLYEIDEALKRINDGTYGICEISNKQILRARLEARPFSRYTVECQAELEKRQHVSGSRVPVSALFGITEEENESEDEEGFNENSKD